MERRHESTEILSKRASKKWLLPVLWVFLVTWYLTRSPSSSTHAPAPPPTEYELAEEELKTATAKPYKEATSISSPYGTLPNTIYAPANISSSNKAAVIVETRATGSLVPLVLHFANVLGPTWPVIIYTSSENFGSFSTSAALSRYINVGRVVIRPLAEGIWFPNWDAVSRFLTKSWLWEDLAPAEHILIFQADSILCSNAVRSVDDFFEYDYIGAPIRPMFGHGYNGGLSLRRRSSILRILTEFTYMPGQGPEDQWFYYRMKELEENLLKEGEEAPFNLPSMEIARTFAVETIDYATPLGLHQPMRFIGAQDHIISLDEWCPALSRKCHKCKGLTNGMLTAEPWRTGV